MVVSGLWQDRPTWSPDGDSIAYIAIPPSGGFDLLKTRLGIDEKPVTLTKQIIYPSNPKWSPRGDWITVELPEGFAVISPDGAKRRVLSQESYLEHAWSRDGSIIYAVKLSNDLHLMLVTVSVDTGAERELADLGPSPPVLNPLQGLSLSAYGTSLLTSMPRLKGDLWLLEGFDEPQGMIQRLGARLRR
jgi:Tol biopolymer transport system component